MCDSIPYKCIVIGINSKINVHDLSYVKSENNLRLRSNKQIAKSS